MEFEVRCVSMARASIFNGFPLLFSKCFSLYFSRLSLFFTVAKLGDPPRTDSVILSGIGKVFSLNPKTGRTIKK